MKELALGPKPRVGPSVLGSAQGSLPSVNSQRNGQVPKGELVEFVETWTRSISSCLIGKRLSSTSHVRWEHIRVEVLVNMFVPVNWQLESSGYPAEDEATMQLLNSR